jgi:AcrR family transcriptional regulator
VESGGSEKLSEPRKLTKGERTAQRIMDVAEKLFAEQGYEGTSLREIASASDIQEPGLYRHFESKEALYNAVLERALGPLLELLNREFEDGISLEQVALLPGMVIDVLSAHPHIAFLFQQAVLGSHGKDTAMHRWLGDLLGSGKALVDAAPLGEVNDEDTAIRILNLFNLCIGYFSSDTVIQGLLGKSASDCELIEKQKLLLNDIARQWLGLADMHDKSAAV